MNIQHVDAMGNRLHLFGEELHLILAKSGEIRALGVINRQTWHVTREPSYRARGQGHFHFDLNCWLLNYHALKFSRSFGFNAVHFIGYNRNDERREILRSVRNCLRENVIHFKEQGFELQIEFHEVDLPIQEELFQ